MRLRKLSLFCLLAALAVATAGCDVIFPGDDDGNLSTIELPEGFTIEKVADQLNYPTSVTWDDQGRMYVAEGGGGLGPPSLQVGPIRILRVEPSGATTVMADLEGTGINVALVGLTWHDGAFYVTHRADDQTGAVSRVTMDGQVTQLFSGIIDSQAEHQINDIRVGPDGQMYVSVGLAGNAAVMGPDLAGNVMLNPDARATPCEDITLTGRNFQSVDFRTEQPGDSALTGAYVPFGTETQPGEVIAGVGKCGGSILAFDPDNAEATLSTYAWGFRNLLGLAWDPQTGDMYAAQNGFDIRGSRPVNDVADPTLRIQEGEWYGHPDFSAERRPLTEETFEVVDSLQAPVFVDGAFIGKDLGFVIDHEASGLDAPDPSLIAGLHPFHSSPSLMDIAPASWGDFEGQLFVAEWGDLTPGTDPTFTRRTGFRVARVNPVSQEVAPFASNQQPGPASMQGARGQGIERPFDVKFGPDGAMYIVDYGVVEPSPMGPPEQIAETGVIWKVTRTSD